MSQLIDLQLLDADAIYTAKHGLDPQDAVMAWPIEARERWQGAYAFQREVMEHERTARAA